MFMHRDNVWPSTPQVNPKEFMNKQDKAVQQKMVDTFAAFASNPPFKIPVAGTLCAQVGVGWCRAVVVGVGW